MELRISIHGPGDISRAKVKIRELATSTDFPVNHVEELVIVVSELASNIVRYAQKGELVLSAIDGPPPYIKVEALDEGPGISNIEQALGDGFSTGNSLGYGLGSINRLMDTLEIQSNPQSLKGTRICCTKLLEMNNNTSMPNPFSVGIASRPYPGIAVNGDSFYSKWDGGSLLVGIIDGLGHGQHAHEAAEKVRHYVKCHSNLSLGDIFQGASRVSRGGRGGVMALVRLTKENDKIVLTHGSLGNVEARILGEKQQILPIKRGILGKDNMIPRIHSFDLQDNDTLVLFSDGLSSKWSDDIIDRLQGDPPELISRVMLETLGKNNDDATVIVVKHRKDGVGQ